MDDDIEVSGLEDLVKAFEEMGPKMCGKALKDALDYSGSVLQEAQVLLAPIDPAGINHPAGQLKQDIRRKIRMEPESGLGTVAIGPSQHSFFGSFAEFGTSHQPATPWMRPAWDAAIDPAMEVFAEVIDTYITNYCKGK